MKKAELQDFIVDILTEYLPSSIKKAAKEEVAAEIIVELSDDGSLQVDDEDEEIVEDELDFSR